MNFTKINKAMKLAERHVVEEFKNKVQGNKYTEIDTKLIIVIH